MYFWFISAIEKVAVDHQTSLLIAYKLGACSKALEGLKETSDKLKAGIVLKDLMDYCSQPCKPTLVSNVKYINCICNSLFLRYTVCYKNEIILFQEAFSVVMSPIIQKL